MHSCVSIVRLRDDIELPLAESEPIMDLNYLYQRYFISLRMSEGAACVSSRIAHRKLAEGYAVFFGQAVEAILAFIEGKTPPRVVAGR